MLVTIFGIATRHAPIGDRVSPVDVAHADGLLVHGLHDVFAVGILFTLAAPVTVTVFVRRTPDLPRPRRRTRPR